MGITRMSGPMFGASGVQFVVSLSTVATAQSAAEVYEITVPTTQDWIILNAEAYCTTAGSAAATFNVTDDGTDIFSAAGTLVAATPVRLTAPTTDGEDIGTRVAAGSALKVVMTTGNTSGPSNVQIQIIGSRRDLDPTFVA